MKRTITTLILLFAVVLTAFGGTKQTDKDPVITGSLSIGYDSKYMFRGVDIIPHSGLFTTELYLNTHGLSLDIWGATGVNKQYQEIDFNLGYSRDVGPMTVSVGGIYYMFPGTGVNIEDSGEVYLGVSTTKLSKYVTPSLTYFYAFGPFHAHSFELRLQGQFEVHHGLCCVQPYVLTSYGIDYNVKGSHFNNIQAGIQTTVPLTKTVSLQPYIAWSHAFEGARNLTPLRDTFWGGARLSISF